MSPELQVFVFKATGTSRGENRGKRGYGEGDPERQNLKQLPGLLLEHLDQR